MERYQVILAYDGTRFHGSQYQTDTRTVQNVFEDALTKLKWSGSSVLFAGRTDAGVHASNQVASFDLEWNHSPLDLRNALNVLLPGDVAVRKVLVRSLDFHPRFDAISRTYCYRIYCQSVRDPTRDRYAWRFWPKPDISKLQTASKLFVGIHDFSGFGRATNPGGNTTRNVLSAQWSQIDDEIYFNVSANAFLYHMVRRLVYAQMIVGKGDLSIEELSRFLTNLDTDLVQGLAPPQGLSLIDVEYPGINSENDGKY
jgi:tRNA pseudouridine38-40 synthase